MLVRAKIINLKEIMRRNLESHLESPCRSVFTFFLISCRCDLSIVSNSLSSLFSILLRRKTNFKQLMVFDEIQFLCPDQFWCHSRKLHKESFLLFHFHLTTSAFVTICLSTNMADSNRRHDKSNLGENQE